MTPGRALHHQEGGAPVNLDGVRLLVLDRTCDACPSQWNACDDRGLNYYIRYRWGWLMVRLGGVEGPDIFVRRLGDAYDGQLDDDEMLAVTGMEMA